MIRRLALWLRRQRSCAVEGCFRAAGADGTCSRHEVTHLGQVLEVSKDGRTRQRVAGRLRGSR